MKCMYCGFEIPFVPPTEQSGTFVPGKMLFEDCPKCRDEFAKAALTGLLSDGLAQAEPSQVTAGIAYRYADAMLSARGNKNE